MNTEQRDKISEGDGFIAALDQSGGSSGKALAQYGIAPDTYSGDEAMFDLIHEMRTRIVTSPAFTGADVVGAILFLQTMRRQVEGLPTSRYLWDERGVVPFLKVDLGMLDEENGAQLMKPMPELDEQCAEALELGVFGTKMRSVIKVADEAGVAANIAQQFEIGLQILGNGLMPILEPEVDINSPSKAAAEQLVLDNVLKHLDEIGDQQIMLKLTLPDVAGFYTPLIEHPKVLKVVALSGGYNRDDACAKLAENPGMIASFSRALVEGLTAQMSDDEFNSALGASIAQIHAASVA